MLKGIWQGWKKIAHKIGNFQARILLSIFYFIFVAPFGFGIRMFSDPLRLSAKKKGSYWLPREPVKADLNDLRRQY